MLFLLSVSQPGILFNSGLVAGAPMPWPSHPKSSVVGRLEAARHRSNECVGFTAEAVRLGQPETIQSKQNRCCVSEVGNDEILNPG